MRPITWFKISGSLILQWFLSILLWLTLTSFHHPLGNFSFLDPKSQGCTLSYFPRCTITKHLCHYFDWPWHPLFYPTYLDGSTSGILRHLTPNWLLTYSLFLPKSKIIHYIDDILLCSPSLQISQINTYGLNVLFSRCYRVSPSKVHLFTPQDTYLGLTITLTHKAIT